MNVELKSRFAAALDARMQALAGEAEALATEGRADESHHKKAARNIYGIYAQLLSSARDAAAYEKYFATIPENWCAARELAEKYGDHDRVAMEDAKLAALEEVMGLYRACKKEVSHEG